jgi:hypothetical protein
MTPERFREDADPGPCENDARNDARADALREAQEDARAWWPAWARAAGIDLPDPEPEDERLF